MSLKIGVVGATGVVGEEFLTLMNERNFPVGELRLFASERSEGQQVQFRDMKVELQTLKENCFDGLDLVFFSSGDAISKEWAPKAVESGAFAVDNSAAYRMDPEKLLCVPEINGDQLPPKNKPALIANPNCSTIQLVVALAPLHKKFGLKEVKVATYQSVSGGGKAAREELLEQLQAYMKGETNLKAEAFPHPIAFNSLPHIGSFNDEGFCSEEVKIMSESKKILGHPELKISAFTVRVPTLNGHSEAAWATLDKEVSREEILACWDKSEGLVIQDNVAEAVYPTVLETSGSNPVYLGRIHRDPQDTKTWMFWVVADNLRKGAALNGIQIAERIFDI